MHSGWVRANGRTVGRATSGGTERANADSEALFLYLWGADAGLGVSTGRGARPAADCAANKKIALPDWRGRAIGALADMGNRREHGSDSTYFGAVTDTAWRSRGVARRTKLFNIPYCQERQCDCRMRRRRFGMPWRRTLCRLPTLPLRHQKHCRRGPLQWRNGRRAVSRTSTSAPGLASGGISVPINGGQAQNDFSAQCSQPCSQPFT